MYEDREKRISEDGRCWHAGCWSDDAVAQNGSNGTDHGKGGPMFVLGGGVKGGLYGSEPSLTDLNDGDITPKIDFRHVYATILEKWMGADSSVVMGQRYPLLDFVK